MFISFKLSIPRRKLKGNKSNLYLIKASGRHLYYVEEQGKELELNVII